jgi:riboflavin kinase/FMN adenylyltransferase
MIRFTDLASAAARRDPAVPRVAAVGYFDGLHIGHQRVLAELKGWASRSGAEPAVVTFDRHPQEVISGSAPLRILSVEHKLLLLERCGIEAALVLPFTRELSLWSPEEFVERVLIGGLEARRLLMGFDSAFGSRRQGTFEHLSARADSLGIEVRRAGIESLEGARVSSTLVRTALLAADLPGLERLLGRRFSLLGRVVRGDGRGRSIGYPTANLDTMGSAAPPPGVYFAEVEPVGWEDGPAGPPRDARRWAGLVNVGRRPTFGEGREITVEVHILGLDADLYGRLLEAHFLERHRDEMKFPSAAALVAEIRADEAALRRRHPGLAPPRSL